MRAPADGRACCLRLVLSCLVLSVLFVCGERAGAVCLLCDCVGARHVCPACFVSAVCRRVLSLAGYKLMLRIFPVSI